jgi:hypothetical protein
VRWHLLDLGSEPDAHTAHWHGNVVTGPHGQTADVVELLPASMKTVDMRPDAPGLWMFHCHVADHMEAGMMTQYLVLPRRSEWPSLPEKLGLGCLVVLGVLWVYVRASRGRPSS